MNIAFPSSIKYPGSLNYSASIGQPEGIIFPLMMTIESGLSREMTIEDNPKTMTIENQ